MIINGLLEKETIDASSKIYFKLLYSEAFNRMRIFLGTVGSAWERNVTKMREHVYVHVRVDNFVSSRIWVFIFVQIMKSKVRMFFFFYVGCMLTSSSFDYVVQLTDFLLYIHLDTIEWVCHCAMDPQSGNLILLFV